jgi:hypothetical protein
LKNNLIPDSKLVLKILSHEILITTSFENAEFVTHTKCIRWKLPKEVNPNDINNDLELLVENLNRLSKSYALSGKPVTVILPHTSAPLKKIDIPLNLSDRADRKEFETLTKIPYDFWKEHDEDLADKKNVEIRSHHLISNSVEGSSSMLYCSAPSKIIKDYLALCLGGNLYPESFISEDQAILKLIESRLTRLEKERPFCIFHLSKGNHRLIHCSNESLNIARIDISDLDENLLSNISSDSDMNNIFWKEVGERIAGVLKQGVNYLREEVKVPKFDTIFFLTDFKDEYFVFNLFHKTFRLANFRTIINQLAIEEEQKVYDKNIFVPEPDREKASESGFSTSIIPNIGAYKFKTFNESSITNLVVDSPILNLHPQSKFIASNLKLYSIIIPKLKILSIVILILGVIDGANNFVLKKESIELEDKYKNLELKIQDNNNNLNLINNDIEQANKKNTRLIELSKGKNNNNLLQDINFKLPDDMELEKLIIRNENFGLYGNSKNVSEVNRFYKELSLNKKISNLKIEIFKRADSNLNYFEIKGTVN